MINCPICNKECKSQRGLMQHLFKFYKDGHIELFSKFTKLEILNSKPKKIVKQKKECFCAICEKPFYSIDKTPRKTCSEECKKANQQRILSERNKKNTGKTYEEIYGKEKAAEICAKFSLERTKDPADHAYIYFYCKCGRSRLFERNTKEEFVCKHCKKEKNYLQLPCDNCGILLKILKNEVQEANDNIKYSDRAYFFCNRKCYLEFYRSHPDRYKEQRRQAGFASVKSFREKKNFEHAGIKFSSATEMKCAQYIEKELNIVLAERINCHVLVNFIEVDFLINKVVIEYHQCHRKTNLSLKQRIEIWKNENHFRYEYRTKDEYYKCRKKSLPKDYKLIVVETEREFYKIKEMFND